MQSRPENSVSLT